MGVGNQAGRTTGRESVAHYDASYGNFGQSLYADIRRETYADDIGQNGWLTSAEQDRFIEWLRLGAGSRLPDIACGAGGPTLRIASHRARKRRFMVLTFTKMESLQPRLRRVFSERGGLMNNGDRHAPAMVSTRGCEDDERGNRA